MKIIIKNNLKSITRRHARECALKALYSWKLSNNDNILEIERYVLIQQCIQHLNVSYFHKLYIGVVNYISELNQLMMPYLSRDLKNLGYIEHLVLCVALFELTKCFDVPYKVVINEAIELSKIYGAEKSHKFVNGVLDKVVVQLYLNKK